MKLLNSRVGKFVISYLVCFNKNAHSDFVKECIEPEILQKCIFFLFNMKIVSFVGVFEGYINGLLKACNCSKQNIFVVLHSAVCLQFQQKFLYLFIFFCFTQNAYFSTCRKSTQRTILKTQ